MCKLNLRALSKFWLYRKVFTAHLQMTSWEFQYFQSMTSFKNAPYQTVVTNTWWSSVRLILTQEQRRWFGVFLKSKSKESKRFENSVTIFGDLLQIWLLLTPICYLNFHLATWPFWLLFWLLLKTWQKTGFKPVSNWFWLYLFVLWCNYFCLLKELWCRYFGFSKVLWCRSLWVFKSALM